MKKKFFFITIFFLLLFLYPIPYTLYPTFAQSCGSATNPRAQGLVSTPELPTTKFGTTGGCVIDPKAAFVPFKIPTYDDLKSLYFDRSKATKSTSLPTTLTSTYNFSGDTVYFVNGDLTVNSTPGGSGTQVIFVAGNLNINASYTYGSASRGTLLIVKGNINIASTVRTINAVLMSEGIIYTAGGGCSISSVSSSDLTINGSLISLNQAVPSPIRFCRILADNSLPAEKINNQVKYLVLMRNLYSETLEKWSEISANPTPTPAPTPSPSATPTPTPTPGPNPPVFDAASSLATSASASSLSWNHITGTGSNRLLIVGVSMRDNSQSGTNIIINSVTYAGMPLARVGAVNNGANTTTSVRVELWYLINPPSVQSSIIVTPSASVRFAAGATSWSNVNQTNPLGTFASATGTSTSPSVNVVSAAGELVVDTLAATNGTLTAPTAIVGSGQTKNWNIPTTAATGGSNIRSAGSYKTGALSTSMGWTLDSSSPWALGAVPIKP